MHDTALPNLGLADNHAVILCLSHLRWGFVFQRPQHLMARFAKTHRVVYWEEPQFRPSVAPLLDMRTCEQTGVLVVTPQLPEGITESEQMVVLRGLLGTLATSFPKPSICWYYTPMMFPFSKHIEASAVIYDCMDELSAFKFAPAELLERERDLLEHADLVFTGGRSLFEAKKGRHEAVHCFPSSVDQSHFLRARERVSDPQDQAGIAKPRFGYFGVIDERIDLDLIDAVARARPDWNLVMVGPVVKIAETDLPRRPNIHWLGGKQYGQLPDYLSGWQAALMPFALNEATRFISPTKTPEYLAGGKVVISTPVTDVVADYGNCPRVLIADGLADFVAACDAALGLATSGSGLAQVDEMLAATSWDRTQAKMATLIQGVDRPDRRVHPIVSPSIWPAPAAKAYDWLVVGAGFAGAVMAERLARGSGQRVLVIDQRPHIAGNAYDERNEAGHLYHKYGPHLFHTNSEEVFSYLSGFTAWRNYEHRVLAQIDGQLVPIPINRTTINALYEARLATDDEAARWFASRAEPVQTVCTSEDVVVSAIGRELYEKFFRGYTRKQWALDPSELDKSVTARVPTRTNVDDRYFTDRFQAIPEAGYSAMFARMLDHPNIHLLLGAKFADVRDAYSYDRLVYTGPIDEYYDFRFGRLPYRSLRFDHQTLDQEQFQPTGTVNYPDEAVPYTRITEYKHFTGDRGRRTTITTEYPAAEGDPYYPIPRAANFQLFKRYEALARAETDTLFVGRLATYRYYNMDQVVGQALATWRKSELIPVQADGVVPLRAIA